MATHSLAFPLRLSLGMRKFRPIRFLEAGIFSAGMLLLLAGCGSGLPELGEVGGIVTLDGEPLSGALVSFTPREGGRTSQDITDAVGRYELVYSRDAFGAKTGQHEVSVSTQLTGGAERLPPRYHSQTELTAQVEPGENTIDFKLTSQ